MMTTDDPLTFAIQGAFALFRTSKLKASMYQTFGVPYRYQMLSSAVRQMR
jgi:hypothetical protein